MKSTVLDWGSGEPQPHALTSHKLPEHQHKNTLKTVLPIVSSTLEKVNATNFH